MMPDTKFSVSMCVYGKDNPEWFRTAVDSILNQTRKPDEVVLVVDGPVPQELDDVINPFEQNSIFKVIRLPENKGHGEARRVGLNNCSNELVALMDADDISAEDRFEKQLAMFESDSKLTIVGGNITEFVGTPDNIVEARVVKSDDASIKEDMKKRCPMNQVTVMFKKSRVDSVGGYIDWYCEEDTYLWLRLFLDGAKFANLPDYLVNVRIGKEMYQRRGGTKYFMSEAKLQKFMLDNKIIGLGRFAVNVGERFVVQVLLPNKLRSWVFKNFARKTV
ncbi:MAG: glycosyltransferase [Clostridia bacterium]|nr:glycosyltransferase [Clostridia bacterium]